MSIYDEPEPFVSPRLLRARRALNAVLAAVILVIVIVGSVAIVKGVAEAILGPDIVRDIVLDAEALSNVASTRRALERAWAWWTGDGTRGEPLTAPLFARQRL